MLSFLFPPICPLCAKELLDKGEHICKICSKKQIFIKEPTCYSCGKSMKNQEKEYCLKRTDLDYPKISGKNHVDGRSGGKGNDYKRSRSILKSPGESRL